MPPTTILESFRLPLPPVPRTSEDSPPAHVSGTETRDAHAPNLAVRVSVNDWVSYADSILNHQSVRNKLTRKCLAEWEPSRRLWSEGDVADAAAVHLTSPVDSALCAGTLDMGKMGFGGINQVTNDNVRADKCWFADIPDTDYLDEVFAVLGFKNQGVIRTAELERATKRVQNMQDVRTHVQRNPAGYFPRNSRTILQQAVSYAKKYETKYIAIFDWDVLVLLHLADQEGTSGGEYCYMTVITDRRKMRSALLGFLARAYDDHMADTPLGPLRQL